MNEMLENFLKLLIKEEDITKRIKYGKMVLYIHKELEGDSTHFMVTVSDQKQQT